MPHFYFLLANIQPHHSLQIKLSDTLNMAVAIIAMIEKRLKENFRVKRKIISQDFPLVSIARLQQCMIYQNIFRLHTKIDSVVPFACTQRSIVSSLYYRLTYLTRDDHADGSHIC